MNRSIIAAVASLAFAGSALANGFNVSAGYTNISDDLDGQSMSIGALMLAAGYEFKTSDTVTVEPRLRYGIGMSEETITLQEQDLLIAAETEMESFLSLSVRGTMAAGDKAYLFVEPSYSRIEMKATLAGVSASESGSEYGMGLGAGYQFNVNTSVELTYEAIDSTDLVSAAVRFRF